MPIKGMTDQVRAQFPRIGTLRKGAPKPKDGNKPGQDLKWFRFVTDDAEAEAAFHAAFGDNPARINVMLPFGTTDENFDAWMEEWGAGSLKHRCDGETCIVWQEDGVYHEPGRCKTCGEVHETRPCPGGCKPTGRLMVIVPDLARLAYVQVLTTSKHDILELTANLRAAEDTARMMGRDLRGIPFILTRVPREISTPRGNGNRVRVEKWLLHIEPAPSWVALQIEAAQRMALPMLDAPAHELPEPNGDDDEEAEQLVIEVTAEELPDNELEQLKLAFFDRVGKKIPYFGKDSATIAKALRGAGFTGYAQDKEDEMFAALQEHANEAANKEAA